MRREKPKLVVLGGPMDGLEFDIDKPELTIGRLDDRDVCLPLDLAVSRRHARLIAEEDAYWLEDVGSTYGTFVAKGDDKINGRVEITPGITFRLGPQTTLKLRLEDVEKKVVQSADRLMRRLASRPPGVPAEKWALLKDQLVAVMHRLDSVSSEEEFLVLLREMTMVIEETLGVQIIFGPQPVAGEPCGDLPAVPEPSPEEGGLETLKTFFKSNLSEIVERMETEELGEAKP
jgi:pSer/pThr/pTyr-binding forkhead associated (FHA) protein